MFVAMGLSAVIPVIHGISLYGVKGMEQKIGLTWLVLQGVLYVVGAFIYAVGPHHVSEGTAKQVRLECQRDSVQDHSIFGEAHIRSFMCLSSWQQCRTLLVC